MKYYILGFEVDSDADLIFYSPTNEKTPSAHKIKLNSAQYEMPDISKQERKYCHYLMYNEELSVTHMAKGTIVVLSNYFWVNILYKDTSKTLVEYRKTDRCTDVIFAEIFLTEIIAIIMKKIGLYVIHGGLFEYRSKKFLVLGCGGTGKSSFIAAVCRLGATFLSDDMVPVFLHENGICASPGHLYYKLCADCVNAFQTECNSTSAHHAAGKIAYRLNPRPINRKIDTFKIDYILTLQRTNRETCVVSKMSVANAFKRLLGSQICAFSNTDKEMLEYLAIIRIAAQIPSYQYSYLNGFEYLDPMAEAFLKLAERDMLGITSCTP